MTQEVITASVEPAFVFELIGDPRNDPKWYTRVSRVEPADQEVVAGARYQMFGDFPRSPAEIRIAKIEPLRLTAVSSPLPGVRIEMSRVVTTHLDGTEVMFALRAGGLLKSKAIQLGGKELQRMALDLARFYET